MMGMLIRRRHCFASLAMMAVGGYTNFMEFKMTRKSALILIVSSTLLAGCQSDAGPKETIGAIGGGALGALAGSQFGGGSGRLVGAGVGGALGAIIGGQVGRSMDREDY